MTLQESSKIASVIASILLHLEHQANEDVVTCFCNIQNFCGLLPLTIKIFSNGFAFLWVVDITIATTLHFIVCPLQRHYIVCPVLKGKFRKDGCLLCMCVFVVLAMCKSVIQGPLIS